METTAKETASVLEPLTEGNFSETFEQYAVRFEQYLQEFLSVDNPAGNLHEGLEYGLGLDLGERSKRGKRIRPVLTLMTCATLGGREADAMPFALAVELLHNFALVHDDIEDGDETRRNRPAVWKVYGLHHGVNIGDYFLCQVYHALLRRQNGARLDNDLRLRLVELITDTLEHTIRGQALDMNARGSREFTLEQYLDMVMEKTGYYLAAPLLGGAMVARAGQPVIHALGLYGRHLGPLFQIKDDLIDLTAGKGRGERGSDIREGKRSYLVAWTLPRCEPEEREQLLRTLDKPREETTPEEIEWSRALFERHGAIEQADQYCAELHRKCVEAIRGCPSEIKSMLELVANYLAQRTK